MNPLKRKHHASNRVEDSIAGALPNARTRHPLARERQSESVRELVEQLSGRKYGCSLQLPTDWRDHLCHPDVYYRKHIEKLSRPNGAGYSQGRCPFHDDHNASLSVRGAGRGAWKCFASCGGGDLVSFHMRLTGLPFADAVRELVEGRA